MFDDIVKEVDDENIGRIDFQRFCKIISKGNDI